MRASPPVLSKVLFLKNAEGLDGSRQTAQM